MIKACENLKAIIHNFSSIILTSEYKDFEQNDFDQIFSAVKALLTGKTSLLKAIEMFAMTIQLYEVGSTDLDEIAEALRGALEGLNFYIGISKTLVSLKPEIKEANQKVVDELTKSQRFISFALCKVAARLVNGE